MPETGPSPDPARPGNLPRPIAIVSGSAAVGSELSGTSGSLSIENVSVEGFTFEPRRCCRCGRQSAGPSVAAFLTARAVFCEGSRSGDGETALTCRLWRVFFGESAAYDRAAA
ncbi:MAG: hypothetical protein ACLU9S_00505 [Oscillospiraceae bacterium]